MLTIPGIIASANYPRVTSSYESIATVTVGAGGSASVEFTSIASTWTHLQIRGIGRTTRTDYVNDNIKININSDTGNNYTTHSLFGDGASATASGFSALPPFLIAATVFLKPIYFSFNCPSTVSMFSASLLLALGCCSTGCCCCCCCTCCCGSWPCLMLLS